jgi:Ca-activated chloride channel family protein
VLKDDELMKARRRVEGKTFYLVNDVWTDSEFKVDARLPETAVTFGSDEYFALLKQNPKLGSYFALGERIVVVFEGRVYKVNAPTP